MNTTRIQHHASAAKLPLFRAAYQPNKRVVALAVLCGMISLVSVPASASSFVAPEWRLTHHTPTEKLPQDCINAVAQAHDGTIWLATHGGLVQFDGRSYSTFNVATHPALGGNRILSVFAASNGDLWIGTARSGVARFRDGKFTSFAESENAPRSWVRSIVEDGQGRIWFGGEGLVRFAGDEFELVKEYDPAGPIWSLHVDSDDTIWIASSSGLSSSSGGQLRPITGSNPALSEDARFVGADSSGAIWVSGLDWLATVKDHSLVPVPIAGDLQAPLAELLVDDTGVEWFVGQSSTCQRGNEVGSWRTLKTAPLQTGDSTSPRIDLSHATCAIQDREGSVWVGTRGRGLFQFRRTRFTPISLPVHGRATSPVCLTGTDHNEFWVILDDELARTTGAAWERVALPPDVGSAQAIASSDDGGLWVACSEQQLLKIGGNSQDRFGHQFGTILRMHHASDSSLWVVADSGVIRIHEGRFENISGIESCAGLAQPVTMYESPQGKIWIGANRALMGYLGGTVERYDQSSGLPNAEIRSVYQTRNGDVWVTTYGAGLARLRDGTFASITVQDGLPDDQLGKILGDANENLWVNSNRGVFRASLRELNAFADGQSTGFDAIILETGEGNGWTGGKTDDGRLWFPAIGHLSLVNPTDVETNGSILVPTIQSVLVDGSLIPHDQAVTVESASNHFEIRFGAASFVNATGMRFRYKLEGYDSDWIESGPRRSAHYSKIPSGDYRFRVSVRGAGGAWSDLDAPLSLHKVPALVETRWFQASIALAILAGFFGVHKLRIRALRRASRLLEEDVRKRATSEELLRRSERKYRGLFDSSIAAVYAFDRHLRFVDANRAGVDLLGFSKAELLERHVTDVHGADQSVASIYKRLLSGEFVTNVQHQLVRKDGSVVSVLNNSRALLDARGLVVGVQSTLIDITVRQRAEETLNLVAAGVCCETDDTFYASLVRHLATALDVAIAIVATVEPYEKGVATTLAVHANGEPLGNFSYDLNGTPCGVVVRDSFCIFDRGVAAEFPSDKFLGDNGIESYCGVPLANTEGRVIGILVVLDTNPFADVAHIESLLRVFAVRAASEMQRQQSDVALRVSERRFRSVFDQAAVGMVVIDTETGRFVRINEKFSRLTDYSNDNITKKTWMDLCHPNDVESPCTLSQCLDEHGTGEATLETRLVGKSGTIVWVKVTASSIWQHDGDLRHQVIIVEDISARKLANEALHESEVRQSLLVSALPISFYVCSAAADFSATWVSDQIEEVSGFATTDFLEKGGFWRSRIHPADRERTLSVFRNLVIGRDKGEVEAEYRWLHADGEYRWFCDRAKLLRDEQGETREVVGTWIDITERKKTEEEARRREAETAHVGRLITMGEMTAGIAHELNQPLAAIANFAAAGRRNYSSETGSPERVFDSFERIEAMAARAGDVIRRLRGLSQKRKAGALPTDLNAIVNETLPMIAFDARLASVSLIVNLDPDLPTVTADTVEMQQVLLNLLRNALESMKSGAVPPHELRIGTARRSNGVELTVSDSGPGIHADVADRLFDPFVTSKLDGLGIGLSISKNIIEEHGGGLRVYSNSTRGVTFYVTVPLVSPLPPPNSPPNVPDSETANAPEHARQ